MATTSLTERLQALSVADTSAQARTKRMCLPFIPGEDFESARVRSGQVDRYLYRLYDKYSDGSTDSVRVRSKDACRFRKSSYVDIFARADRDVAAQALRRHLQWEGKPDDEDNFVSWTSSLLLVLQYAFYREQYYANLDFAEINICVVDTCLMPTGVFMNDMALIEAFSRYDSTGYKSLAGLKTLRQSKYYFGEYLSQGTLSIDGCCSVVSMRQIMNDGLGLLRPEFLEAEASNGQWANRVVALREMFRISGPHCDARVIEVDAALQIGKRFGTSWQVPIALAFLALKPRRSWDETIIKAFRKLYDTGTHSQPSCFDREPTLTQSRRLRADSTLV
jgi:hypothetical protein